ncbi:hypothetical protein NQ315_004863 [Exocentrus adspersus]|uniref:Uncharacterized protein n=1 Tax=Exocentrus adspersus TaxID=1586481 RepID=A0AAV8W2H8_9CUCU|nr:hypothetical protein NQ315_004863 [Exocentrus adspersus]
MDHGHEEEKKIHPWQRANFLSRLTFMYTRSIFWKTYITNKLEEEDLYQVPLCYKSEKLGDELENCLENDLETHKVASIYRILWSCYGKEYLFIGLIQLMVRTIVVTTIPMTLSKLVLYFQPYQETISKGEACLYAVLLITLNLFNIIYTHNYMLTITAFGIKVKTAFCSLMYRRSLKLTGTSLSEISTGKIITLMTKDVTAFEKIILYGNDIWIGFAQAGIVCYLIYRKMGIAAVSGVGFLFLVIPFQVYIGKKASNLRLKTAAMTDERLQVTQEVVSAIKLIKMVEVGIIAKIFLIKVVILLIGGLTSKIAFYFLVMTYVWLGHTISAELVFFTLTLFQRLRHALSVVVPLGITEFAELHACVNRIGGLFRAEKLCQPDSELISTTPNISLKVVTVAIKDKPIIKNVTAAIESGLTFLTGALGSGKSTLLKTILRDYNLSEGIISVKGRISYASQEPWIFPSTLKQNIVFWRKIRTGYTRSIFWRTYITNKLEEEDLYQVPLCYKSEKLGDELENCLENDLETHKVASIYRILWSCYGKEYLFIGLIQLMVRTIVVTTIPMTLSKLVLYFQPYQETISKGEACLYAVLLITLNLFNIIYTHNYMLTITAFGIKVKTAFCSLMYRRSLKLTGTSLSEISTGKIITLMTKDVTAFEKIILYGNDIWIGFAQAGIVCYLIYRKMGIAAVSGVGFLFLVIPFQGDNMVIGDKGINLSKGQKARINLARAVYKDCEIYLLDDCLAALDAHVKDHVYNECIRGFLKQKLCVLACNNLEYVQSGDTVMVIDNGTLKSCIKITNKDTKNAIDTTTKVNDKFDDGQANKNNNDTDDEESRLLDRGKSIYHEVKKSGKVGAENYKRYISYGGGYFMVDLEENLTYFEANNLTATDEYGKMTENRSLILILFSSLILATTLLYIITSYLFFNFTRKVSNRLHKAMVGSIINAVTTFFDKIFIGNILNRFSNDLAIIDEHFPFDVYEFIEIFLALCGVLTILATVNISFLVPATTVLILLLFIRKCYMPTGRNLQRLESATRSPVVGYVNASLEGLTTIRAFQAERLLIEEFDKHQDHYTSTSFTNKCCVRAFGLAVDTCCTIFIAVIAGYFLTLENDSSVGDVGLAITQAFMLSGLVQYGIRKWADLENKMTSVERVLEYTTTEQEIKNKGLRPLNWPSEGKIQVENLSLSYSNSEECVLKNVNFKIEATQKIGVVQGKLLLYPPFFRLYDYKGKIVIDEIDIREIALEFLRRSVAIIPQDPVLFTGTVRSNIDPLASHQDSDIWSAIKKVKLVDLIKSLDMRIADSGSNFSAGQKQLLCLARAIVGRNKILVLDEATANMDDETDALIHGVIEEHFASCTVLTIVHKLQNVLKCDKVMLIESGEVVEYDNPKVLLKNKNGHFYKMIEKAGLLSSK